MFYNQSWISNACIHYSAYTLYKEHMHAHYNTDNDIYIASYCCYGENEKCFESINHYFLSFLVNFILLI